MNLSENRITNIKLAETIVKPKKEINDYANEINNIVERYANPKEGDKKIDETGKVNILKNRISNFFYTLLNF